MRFFPKSRERIRREASDWVVRLAGQAGAADHAAFQRWRQADPRHAAAYDRIAAIWNQAARLSPASAVDGLPSDARPDRRGTMGLALAASLAALFLVVALLLGSRLLDRPGEERDRLLFAAAVGEIRQVELPDGSRLTLDSDSRVEAEFTTAERRLTLSEGRARFQVAHDTRPLAVRAGTSEVVATGTLFDVSLIGGRTTVLLIEGSVEVRSDHDRGTLEPLRPGHKLVLAASGPAERRPVSRGDVAWPKRMLEFDNVRLDEAAAMANRYNRVQLHLADERIRGLRVSGAFRAGDVAGFARGLAKAFGLTVQRQADGNLLLAAPGPADRRAAP